MSCTKVLVRYNALMQMCIMYLRTVLYYKIFLNLINSYSISKKTQIECLNALFNLDIHSYILNI